MNLIAEMTPDATIFLNLVGSVGLLATVGLSVKQLFNKNEAQKREVSFTQEFARREEVERIERNVERLDAKLEATLESIRAEMRHDRDRILAAGEERATKIHERIDSLLSAIAELRKKG